MYLLDHGSKQSPDALIDQTLHVVDRLLVRQVQSELVLHLGAEHKRTWSSLILLLDGKMFVKVDGFIPNVPPPVPVQFRQTYLPNSLVRLKGNVWNIGVHHEREQIQDQVGVSEEEEGRRFMSVVKYMLYI